MSTQIGDTTGMVCLRLIVEPGLSFIVNTWGAGESPNQKDTSILSKETEGTEREVSQQVKDSHQYVEKFFVSWSPVSDIGVEDRGSHPRGTLVIPVSNNNKMYPKRE